MDTPQTITAADRVEIIELAARFNHAMDEMTFGGDAASLRGSKAALLQTFTVDGVLEVVGGVAIVGHDALSQMCDQHMHDGVGVLDGVTESFAGLTVHRSSDHVIDPTGTGAVMKSYMVRYFQLSAADVVPHGMYVVTQRFDDELVRGDGGGWRFASRRITGLHRNADREVVSADMPAHFAKQGVVPE